MPVNFTGRPAVATGIEGSVPGPVLRWRQGDEAVIRVENRLPVTSSIHWHGIILPSEMDGVPGLSFPGIPPGGSYLYRFRLNQSGTYWYHSHSGFQEQTGMYGAIVVEPAGGETHTADRDYVLLLSDWSDEDPATIFATLKKNAHVYNRNRRSLGDIARDVEHRGFAATWKERAMWNRMRMEDSDLSDVTGYTYTYLLNGMTPAEGWRGLFNKGDRVRLRIINASAMTIFDLRIPDLPMRVISADGQEVAPVTVDECRLAPAETLDVLVEPAGDRAYSIFAQAIDRSGYARGTLTPDPALAIDVPAMDPVPRLQHIDMGMGHGDHQEDVVVTGHSTHHHSQPAHAKVEHKASEYGPQVDMRVERAPYRLDDPGVGLRDNGRRTLTYADLSRLGPSMSEREPDDEVEIHLTGNMKRYMWSMDGVRYRDADPIRWQYGKRMRVTLVNDTMMNHPIHLHGMWSELETGDDRHLPAKHTVVVQPGARISYRVSVDAPGRWAYHCHLLYHMMGMFREVRVT